jgi:hypothetical protein
VNRLANLPLILAGPVLRRVTATSVTVWIAVRQAANVTLEIYSGDPGTRVKVGSGTRHTVAVGHALHILVITAQADLTPGVVYTYDMFFDVPGNVVQTQLAKGVLPTAVPHPLSYPPYDLPSFSLPPSDANDLRIIHGSCRMPHGNGPDALSILDELIRITVQNATRRPHQLLLTGDQIYADDVAAPLLMQLMDASRTLLGIDATQQDGWKGEETLPVAGAGHPTARPSDFPPLTRTLLLKNAGFTSADLRSHLMSFGEYLCMYLFTWSDVLWPPTALPTEAEVLDAVRASPDLNYLVIIPGFARDLSKVDGDLKDVSVFLKTLPLARRALANIPTYMIFDDHDVTDDWNMTPAFCNGVYSRDNPLGRRIVQNALVAYALCQLWGNTPEQFEFDASNKPAAGRKLLTALDGGTAADYELSSQALQAIVGVHDTVDLKNRVPEGVFHDQKDWLTIGGARVSADSLTYNFTYEGTAHQIIVTDTRSWRSYPNGEDATADLIPADQFAAQIPTVPATGDRALIVVVTTNAPPVQPIRGATRHDTLSTLAAKLFQHDAHPDLFEAWEIPSLSFDRLLKAVTDKFDVDSEGVRYGQAVLLSGDVHHSFATRLSYKATNRYGDTQAHKAQAVVAQLVASSFKKQDNDTVGFQRDGYFYVPSRLANGIVARDMVEGYVGWNVPPGSVSYHVGFSKVTYFSSDMTGKFTSVEQIRPITNDAPTIQIFPLVQIGITNRRVVNEIDLTVAPDYRYRLDYLLPSSYSYDVKFAPPIPPVPGPGATVADRKAALDVFNSATGHYREHNASAGAEKVIGRNNISELTFDWGPRDTTGDRRKVNHTVRWRRNMLDAGDNVPDPDFPLTYVVSTTYTVSLDPKDPDFLDKTAAVEGPRP